MSPSRWAAIEKIICEFQGLLAPTIPHFKIEKGVDCDNCPTPKAASPALKHYGVYLIFDDSESLIYIGIAIHRWLIDRIRFHLKKKERFKSSPCWIDVIPFDPAWAFFAPALELYLIDKIAHLEGNRLVNIRGAESAELKIFD